MNEIIQSFMVDGKVVDDKMSWTEVVNQGFDSSCKEVPEHGRYVSYSIQDSKKVHDAMTRDLMELSNILHLKKEVKPHNVCLLMRENECEQQTWHFDSKDGYFAIWPMHPLHLNPDIYPYHIYAIKVCILMLMTYVITCYFIFYVYLYFLGKS